MQPATEDHTNNFVVVGYDAKVMPRDWERGCVCSVDAMVWPSAIPESLWADGLSLGFQGLWSDRDELYAAAGKLQDWRLIGITWSPALACSAGLAPTGEVGDVDGVYGWFREGRKTAMPSYLDADWEFVGYDVADGWLMSAIWNMGFEREPHPIPVIADFFQRLNESGLFRKLEDALEFSVVANDLVTEHAPFSPYGVWSMRS